MNAADFKSRLSTSDSLQKLGSQAYDHYLEWSGYSELRHDDVLRQQGRGITNHRLGETEELAFDTTDRASLPVYHRQAPERVSIKPPSVTEVRDGRLVGRDGVVLTQQDQLVVESLYNSDQTLRNSGGKVKILKNLIYDSVSNDPEHVEGRYCPLVNGWSDGYFHWVADCLTKVQHLVRHSDETSRTPTLLVEPDPPQWKVDSLEVVLDGEFAWGEWGGGVMSFDELVVPSLPRTGDYVSTESLQWLRRRVRNGVDGGSGHPERIYISRRDADSRYIVNEEEVLERLGEFGFSDYCLETLSFEEQVRLFENAEIVVGPHGAGFSNTIFAENADVLEVFGPRSLSHSLCYYSIANSLNLEYQAVLGERVDDGLHVDPDVVAELVSTEFVEQ